MIDEQRIHKLEMTLKDLKESVLDFSLRQSKIFSEICKIKEKLENENKDT